MNFQFVSNHVLANICYIFRDMGLRRLLNDLSTLLKVI